MWFGKLEKLQRMGNIQAMQNHISTVYYVIILLVGGIECIALCERKPS